MLELILKIYTENELNQLALVNWSPDQGDDKQVEICPKRQFLRLMFAGYLVYLIYTLYEQMPFYLIALNGLTCLALTSTYYMMTHFQNSIVLKAWVHSLNNIVMFANAVNLPTFWYYEGMDHHLVRVVNVPALAMFNNMFLTDWCLHFKHCTIFNSICFIYMTLFARSQSDAGMVGVYMMVQHSCLLALCMFQQTVRSRNVVRIKPIPLEKYVLSYGQKQQKKKK